ncbi:MAG: 2-hydroxy-3-oxopropionate reductase [Candidatus Heteroscillospira sp.]|jgi:2-hydroxy-3-oxopropionate reductase
MKVGFIGLGTMGKPMVRNLMKAGHEVVVFNRSQPAIDQMVSEGAVNGVSYAHMGEVCPVIITMVPNAPDVKAVLCGENGVLSTAKEGTIVIDMSSIAPLASQEIAKLCAEKGVRMLEAPVSGGEPKAIDGTLSIMCGGEEALYEECRDILSVMGTTIVYCGSSGAGNTTKLANQVIVAINIAAVSEAFMLAKKAGVDPQRVFEAIRGGLAGSVVMDAKAPMILSGNTRPGFKVDLHIKDLNNALATGHGVGSPLPLTSAVMEMMQTLHADGMGACDHSTLSKYYEKLSGGRLVD